MLEARQVPALLDMSIGKSESMVTDVCVLEIHISMVDC